jgi:hypothetical protein
VTAGKETQMTTNLFTHLQVTLDQMLVSVLVFMVMGVHQDISFHQLLLAMLIVLYALTQMNATNIYH